MVVFSRLAARRTLWRLGWFAGCALLLPLSTRANDPAAMPPLRVLIVGGGPSLEYNQVAIESNVRYVGKLLPKGTVRTTLFADGNANNATVLYQEDPRQAPVGERLLKILLQTRDSRDNNPSHYKKPNLGARLDGPSKPEPFERAVAQIARESNAPPVRPLMLYFTGHGSPGRGGFENNVYDMWEEQKLSVQDLARQMAQLPESMPVTIVMVQCHSGAFANLLFEGGRVDGKPIERDIVGFFATIKEKVAAGCTSEVNEAEYRDFTSYFFAALTGRDRVGRRVAGADYNGDGRVGMDEAYCYTLCHDRSIDVPTCTSDIFLRRFADLPPDDVFKARYSEVRSWANPAQRAALDMLAHDLHRETGEDRLQIAYNDIGKDQPRLNDAGTELREAERRFETRRKEARRTLFGRFPDLKEERESDAYKRAYREAVALLTRHAGEGEWKAVLDADDTLARTDSAEEAQQIAAAHLLRFVRLGKSIILARNLRLHGEPLLKARYDRLIASESKTLLPPVASLTQEASR